MTDPYLVARVESLKHSIFNAQKRLRRYRQAAIDANKAAHDANERLRMWEFQVDGWMHQLEELTNPALKRSGPTPERAQEDS